MYYSARLIFQSAHRLTDSLLQSFHAIDSKFINRTDQHLGVLVDRITLIFLPLIFESRWDIAG